MVVLPAVISGQSGHLIMSFLPRITSSKFAMSAGIQHELPMPATRATHYDEARLHVINHTYLSRAGDYPSPSSASRTPLPEPAAGRRGHDLRHLS